MAEGENISPESLQKRLDLYVNDLDPKAKDLYYQILIGRQVKATKQQRPQPTLAEKIQLVEGIRNGSVTVENVNWPATEHQEPEWRKATDPDLVARDRADADPQRSAWIEKRIAEGKNLIADPKGDKG